MSVKRWKSPQAPVVLPRAVVRPPDAVAVVRPLDAVAVVRPPDAVVVVRPLDAVVVVEQRLPVEVAWRPVRHRLPIVGFTSPTW